MTTAELPARSHFQLDRNCRLVTAFCHPDAEVMPLAAEKKDAHGCYEPAL